jgi:hypothetical protein
MDLIQLQQVLARIEAKADGANKAARQVWDNVQQARGDVASVARAHQEQAAQVQHLHGLMQGLRVGSGKTGLGAESSPAQVGRTDMLSIEEIPGRRIPWDITVQIGIPDSQMSPLPGSYPLSMDGPFVAVARYATFVSSYTFQVTDGSNINRFTGRTWGRQRPISSVLDLMDAMTGWADGVGVESTTDPCVGQDIPVPAVVSRPTSRNPGRSMVFDGYVKLTNGTYPRQNQQVPTSLWAPGFNQMLQLPVLDYWEKGDTIEFEVEPSHANNAPQGNIQALLGSMPYLDGQFDGQEGIMYPAWQCSPDVADVIQRRPAGILIVGLLGFKILQPPGVRLR